MPVYMVFMEVLGVITFLSTYPSLAEAEAAVSNLNLTKGANTTFIIQNGYRYE